MAVLDIIINAIDNASKVIEEVGDKGSSALKKLADNSVAIGAAMTGIGVGAKLVSDNINDTYLGFASAMTEVEALGGITEAQFAKLKDSAIELSTQFPISAEDIANAMYLMISVGYDYEAMMKTIPDATALATAGSMSMAEATNSLINVMGVYGDKAGSAAEISKVFANAVGVGKYEMGDFMSEVMKNIGVAAQLGISFGDLAAYNVALQNSFTNAEEAGTSFNRALIALTDPRTVEKLNEMGIAVTDEAGAFRDLDLIMGELKGKLANVTNEQERMAIVTDLFGTYGQRAAIALMDQAEALPDLKAEMRDLNLIEEQTATKIEGVSQQLEIAKNKMDAAKIAMGEAMAPATLLTADVMGKLAEIIKDLPDPIQTVIGAGIQFSQVFAGIGPMFMAIGPVMQAFSAIQTGTLIPSLTATAAAGWAAVAPWLPLVAAITAVIAVAWLLYDNWEEIAEATRFIWEPLLEFFTGLWDGITKVFQGAIDFVMGLLFPGESIPFKLEDVWSGLKDFFSGLWDNIVGIFGNSFDLIIKILFPPLGLYELISQNWGSITDFVGNLWDNIVKFFSDNFDLILSILFPPKGLYDLISDNWGGIPDFVGGIWDWIVQAFQNGFDLVLKILFPQVGLVELIQSNWGLITDAIQGIWDSVVWIFQSFYNTAASYGRDIVFGLWDGIFSLFSWIHDQITGFGEAIFGWFADGLGALWPHSPSEAGVRIGAGMAAGINKGLHDSMNLVDRAISDLEDAMRVETGDVAISSSARPLLPQVSGKAPMQVVEEHIHYHLDGTYYIREEADIRKVAIELERLRSTKARARGVASW